MSLIIEDASKHIARSVQTRGDAYFARGAVRIVEGSAWHVTAIVSGSNDYQVDLSRDEDAITVSCSCPYYEENLEPCKHIWAAIRKAEADGHLKGSGKGGRVRILTDADSPSEWDEGEEDFFDDEELEEEHPPHVFSALARLLPPSLRPYVGQRRRTPKAPALPTWKQAIGSMAAAADQGNRQTPEGWPLSRQIVYIIDMAATSSGSDLLLEVACRDRKKDGDWSKPKHQRIYVTQIPGLPDPADRQILAILAGAKQQTSYYPSYYSSYDSTETRYRISPALRSVLVPMLCQTGRCHLRAAPPASALMPIQWDEGEPWVFCLHANQDASGRNYVVDGVLQRGSERMPLSNPHLILAGGMLFYEDRAAALDDSGAFYWIATLRRQGQLVVPVKHGPELLGELLKLPHLPRLELPAELNFEQVKVSPRPRLKVRPLTEKNWGQKRLLGELSFDYDGTVIPSQQPGSGCYQPDRRRLMVRDRAAERAAQEQLSSLGFRETHWTQRGSGELAPRHLPHVVRTLVAAGWYVEAEGKLFRQPGAFHIEVSTGIDWFELRGGVEFGDTVATLPALLAALKRGENAVQLGDGTFGMLPEEWLRKYGTIAGLGTAQNDHLRFTKSQVGLLDALLVSQPEATCDAVFARARDELRQFEGIQPAEPAAGFAGQLRGYQEDGLGWFHFLQKFSFGGCLADDMGLGKTVQVLALLESRRELRVCARSDPIHRVESDAPSHECGHYEPASKRPGPSLVVVPRSLVFNWIQEAARFAPKLRVLDHTGMERIKGNEHFDEFDLVITTYGTLRRDALLFKDVQFDYVILDESQAIKNASTESAKAARLLKGDHRLALSGTPIENHLGELWSLFEFLNPGMLGAASVFRLGGTGARNPDEETRTLLARALRPFILRRTKDQVAKDLPQKLEQTLYCELELEQRKLYDELRDHYRQSLLQRVEREGINKSKIQILEALLRLRQAAIHPGLIDKSKATEPSAKLDLLLLQLEEVLDEGHKALVFSQFTSMLAIVRDRLDRDKVPYEYLDGRTRDRAGRVERFQNDPNCKLFLVSLKAGGLGLNLTAAEYVFLLDPWWNPAVEAQAIDRTHRIGQTRQVFAYRLIARNTVEEKVLELQDTKRNLADAIINADNSLIRDLGREDLELLLS